MHRHKTKVALVGSRARAIALTFSVASALVGAGCVRASSPASSHGAAVSPLQTSATQALPPGVSVSCAPGHRAVMRQHAVNGQPTLDVQCVSSVEGTQATHATQAVLPSYATPAPPPVAQYTPAMPTHSPAPVTYDEVVPAPRPAPLARRASYRQDGDVLTYEPRSVRPKRTVKKSAVIIGSSAGAGAGIGAILGGKKGALIGAAIGGGGAALWDQATRRN
jgi:hypothetical protein